MTCSSGSSGAHEFLALMLGVRRAGVTMAMGALQSAGIVTYARGRVVVQDRPRLEEAHRRPGGAFR